MYLFNKKKEKNKIKELNLLESGVFRTMAAAVSQSEKPVGQKEEEEEEEEPNNDGEKKQNENKTR